MTHAAMKNKYEVVGDRVKIFLYKRTGEEFITWIDADKLCLLLSHRCSWQIYDKSKSYRVIGVVHNGEIWIKTTLHRFLLGFPTYLIDHINNDALDNRMSNLRESNKSGNAQNLSGPPKTSTTGVRGVSWDKQRKKWRAHMRVDGKTTAKIFACFEEAEAYVKELRKLNMPFSPEARGLL